MFKIYIRDNLNNINERIEQALIRSGRKDNVHLIAVSKTVEVERIREAIEAGVTDIGENKVQELDFKISQLKDSVNYHMIGYLQTNKVKYIVDKVKLIHSLDRMSLANEIQKRAEQKGIIVDTLIEINAAGEESKAGMKMEEVLPFIESILDFKNIRIKGLMTVAPNTEDELLLRNVFRAIYNLKEDISKRNYEGVFMDYLSMGMSNDFETAIEEGSNMVRVGTGIFGKRNYQEG